MNYVHGFTVFGSIVTLHLRCYDSVSYYFANYVFLLSPRTPAYTLLQTEGHSNFRALAVATDITPPGALAPPFLTGYNMDSLFVIPTAASFRRIYHLPSSFSLPVLIKIIYPPEQQRPKLTPPSLTLRNVPPIVRLHHFHPSPNNPVPFHKYTCSISSPHWCWYRLTSPLTPFPASGNSAPSPCRSTCMIKMGITSSGRWRRYVSDLKLDLWAYFSCLDIFF